MVAASKEAVKRNIVSTQVTADSDESDTSFSEKVLDTYICFI